MCRYQAAADACAVAARRAEYTALNASRLAGGIEDENSQVVREATGLIDEWIVVKDGLGFAEEVLTLAAQNPEAFAQFRREVAGVSHLPTPRRLEPPRGPVVTRAPGRSIANILGVVRGR